MCYFIERTQKCTKLFFNHYLAEKLRTNVAIQPNIDSHKTLSVMQNDNVICILKYTGTKLKCIFADGQTFDVDDTKPLDMSNSIIGHIAELLKRHI